MFAQILWTQTKWTRAMVLGFAALAFLMPVGGWNLMASQAGGTSPEGFIMGFQLVGPLAAFIACLSGFLMAAYPWSLDHAANHVYPLSLPITWPSYVTQRFVAGAILLAIPAVALLVGCLLALSFIALPPVLHAYPVGFALRFFFATLLAYSLSFALQYLGGRRAAPLLLGALIAFLVTGVVLQVLGLEGLQAAIARLFLQWPGPFAIFVEGWRLVDV